MKLIYIIKKIIAGILLISAILSYTWLVFHIGFYVGNETRKYEGLQSLEDRGLISESLESCDL